MRDLRRSFTTVVCSACFQPFEVAGPSLEECPVDWDYDCEICCRPMVISFTAADGEVHAEARGINE